MTRFFLPVFLMFFSSLTAHADGLFGIDHRLNFDNSGIWSRSNQKNLEMGSAAIVLGGALWEGNDTRLGQTFWKSTESMLMGDALAQAGKLVFRRQRPIDGNDPGAWFKSSSNKSFPSGEVTHITAIVTPFIAEYGQDNPAVWALAALPLYDGIARMKSQAHWQTDVLAGLALGIGTGLYAGKEKHNWLVQALPGGMSIGYKKSF
jgi:undecaprenyl-diphosphatase